MKKIAWILLVGVMLFQKVEAQQDSAMQKFSVSFTEYLLKEKLYDDATLYLQQHSAPHSAYYYAIEKLKFQSQKFNNAKLNQLSLSSFIKFNQSYQNQYLLYARLNQLHQAFDSVPFDVALFFNDAKTKTDIWKINSIMPCADSLLYKKAFAIQKMTKQLMLHDTSAYLKTRDSFTVYYPHQFNYSIETLNSNYEVLAKIKNKNVWAAGMMSAVIPGAGKMYYGNWGQGFAALFTTALIAAEAYSGFKKAGVKSVHGWAYTGLFSVFYVGNIWGTVIGLKVKQRKAYENINHNLLDNADKLIERF